jgi:transposase
MLTAICKEYGILGDLESLETLMLFQARKATGDYHANMDSDMFCKWLEENLFPVLDRHGIRAILVMDNASYHCVAAPGSINVKAMTKKSEVTDILERFQVPYRAGRAPNGDTLDQLKVILTNRLKENAATNNLMVGVTRVQQLCKSRGHFKPLMTPPYHPELQPIEKLWRDVKMYVARQFAGTRSIYELKEHVKSGFRKYGTVEATVGKMQDVFTWELKYKNDGVYAEVIDLTLLEDDTDNEIEYVDDDSDSEIDDE